MPWLHRTIISPFKAALGLLVLFNVLLLPTAVNGQLPTCPSLLVSAYARPRRARKPGQAFTIYAKVGATGALPVHNVSLRVPVPFSAVYPPAKPNDAARGRPVIVPGGNAFWPSFSVRPGKDRRFKLKGKVDKCDQSGPFDIDVRAFILSQGCSTPIDDPVQVHMEYLCVYGPSSSLRRTFVSSSFVAQRP